MAYGMHVFTYTWYECCWPDGCCWSTGHADSNCTASLRTSALQLMTNDDTYTMFSRFQALCSLPPPSKGCALPAIPTKQWVVLLPHELDAAAVITCHHHLHLGMEHPRPF